MREQISFYELVPASAKALRLRNFGIWMLRVGEEIWHGRASQHYDKTHDWTCSKENLLSFFKYTFSCFLNFSANFDHSLLMLVFVFFKKVPSSVVP